MLANATSAITNGHGPQRAEDYVDWYLQSHVGVPWDERSERPESPALWSPPCRDALFTAYFGLLPAPEIKIFNYRYYNPYIEKDWSR